MGALATTEIGRPHRAPPLVVHVVYRFGVGGLENGVVNLINRLPREELRHAILALTECDDEFCRRIERDDVELISLHKPPGHGWRLYGRVWQVLRALRPAIVHTRNLAALEMQAVAAAAGVPVRIHGEHGRDVSDPDGSSQKYRWLRRAYSPLVTRYVTVSIDLERYLTRAVGIRQRKVTQIYNGVDERRFSPRVAEGGVGVTAAASQSPDTVVFGSVGRLQEIKGQRVLIAAVARALADAPQLAQQMRVRLVGDGPLRPQLERDIEALGLRGIVELVGERSDVAAEMRTFDVFALPSLGEGISNTILEAMASGLPVVATAVGGNTELVADGVTGTIVPPSSPEALAAALLQYLRDPALRGTHGVAGRAAVEGRFALSRMVESYRSLYRETLIAYAPRRLAFSG